MEQNERILSLCESCINALKTVLTADLPMNINMSLTQKLFLLETGLEDLQAANSVTSANISANLASSDTKLPYAASVPDIQMPATAADHTVVAPYAYYTDKYPALKDAVTEFEKDIILSAIEENGSKRKAATALGMDHSTLIKKCQRYGI